MTAFMAPMAPIISCALTVSGSRKLFVRICAITSLAAGASTEVCIHRNTGVQPESSQTPSRSAASFCAALWLTARREIPSRGRSRGIPAICSTASACTRLTGSMANTGSAVTCTSLRLSPIFFSSILESSSRRVIAETFSSVSTVFFRFFSPRIGPIPLA